MKQYLNILSEIISTGIEKESGRANMPNTIGISKSEIVMNLQDGFPLLTTKKMYWKGIVHELLWFLSGETNIKYLIDNNVNIWNSDAYRWYKDFYVKKLGAPDMSMDDFLENVKKKKTFYYPNRNSDCEYCNDYYTYGDLGKVYGHQWRNQNGVDQVKDVIEGLKKNPYSRYHIIDSWNKVDFMDMALPPCHLLYHFIVRPLTLKERVDYYFNVTKREHFLIKDDDEMLIHLDSFNVPKFYLDLNMYQRSADMFLGVPFNIASMSLLLMIMAKTTNMLAGVARWIGGDTHIYVDHIPMVLEQLKREPYPLPKMVIKRELNSLDDIMALTIDDFELIDYKYFDAIKAKLFTGLENTNN